MTDSATTRPAERAIPLACKIAAVSAVLLGSLFVMMAWGHLHAVVSLAIEQERHFDFRLVSLITTGALLALPGLIGIGVSFWLWQGRNWAYAAAVFSTLGPFVYLVLLLLIDDSPNVGSELNFAFGFVCAYLLVLAVGWLSLRVNRHRETA